MPRNPKLQLAATQLRAAADALVVADSYGQGDECRDRIKSTVMPQVRDAMAEIRDAAKKPKAKPKSAAPAKS